MPILAHCSSTVLARSACFPEASQHRVGIPGKRNVALDDPGAHPLVKAVPSQALELIVQVKDQGRFGRPPRRSRRPGVETDHEKGCSAEAEREVEILGVGAYTIGVRLAPTVVLVGERLQPRPHRGFELALGKTHRLLEDNGKAAQPGAVGPIRPNPLKEGSVYPKVVSVALHRLADDSPQRSPRQGGLGADTRKVLACDHLEQIIGQAVGGDIFDC